MSLSKSLSRRAFLRLSAIGGSVLLAACAPKIIKETVVVEKQVEKEVTKVVEKQVEKEVTKVVEKKVEVTKVVEKQVTKAPGQRIRVTWYAWGNPLAPGRYADYEKAFDQYGLDVLLQTVLVPSGTEYYVKLMAAVASGTAPDCCSVEGEYLRKFIKEKILTDLKPFSDRDNLDFSQYWEGMMKPSFREGGWWGWPWGSEPSAILYNETLFKEAGLDMPYDLWKKNDWTWDAFLKAAKALTKIDPKGMAQVLGTDDPFSVNPTEVYIKANGGSGWFSENYQKVTVTEPKALEAMQWVLDLNHKPLKFPINFAPVPRTSAGANYYTTWNHNEVGMTSSCKNKEAAWVFLKFFGSEDGGMVWLNSTFFHVVPNKSLMQTDWYRNRVPGFDASVCLEMMDSKMFVGRPEPLEVFRFNDIAAEELSAIRLKKKSLSEGLQTIKDKVEPILAQTEV
jgi:ABC-type glycerol-3-phosphate transport system substrate-binding protein